MPRTSTRPLAPRGHRAGLRSTTRVDSLRTLLTLTILTLFWALPVNLQPVWAAEADPADANVLTQGPLNFEACVRLALQQSPYLTKSSVEIDIRRMDENDSRYSIFPPPMTFRSYYFVNRPNQTGLSSDPYSLSFSMDPYNPFGAYFTLQAQKAITQMAIHAHLKIINEGLEKLGKMFLHLGAMKRMAALQKEQASLCRENLIYAQNRLTIGTGTSLEVRVANQELEVAKGEKDRLEVSQRRLLTSLKNFLGLKPEQPLELDLRDAPRQVLGKFDAAAATLEQAKNRSHDLKILEMKKEMQGYMVTVAKAKILPSILFTTQTPDPLSLTNARGFYVGLGLEIPVWDGFKRIRNISRQKAVLKQFGVEKDLKENDLTDKWNNLQEDLKTSEAGLKFARSQEELVRLKGRQAEIRYQSGSEPLPAWLESRKAALEAQKSLITKALSHDESLLSLRQISGDLGYSYVDPNSWKK